MNNLPPIDHFSVSGAVRDEALKNLQNAIQIELDRLFETIKHNDHSEIASYCIKHVEQIVDRLDLNGYDFFRTDYGGDINYKKSEQSYGSNGYGPGIQLHFKGYSVKVFWDDE